jgi:transcriptional regulator with XRE-family HTH domain
MSDLDQNGAYGSTVGERLRQAREARGQTLDDVASETRIPIRHLRNIEDGNWQDLPAVTYTVGFARAYANAVGLDGSAIGREARDEAGGIGRAPTVSPEIYAPPDPARVPSRSLAWIAGLLLVGLIAAWLLVIRPYLTKGDDTAAPAPTAQETPQQAQPTQPQPAAPPSVSGQPVTLVATGDVWMSITDRASGNRRLYYNTLRSGERFQVPTDAAQPVVQTTNPQNVRVMIGDQDRGPLAPARRAMSNQSLKAEDLAGQLSQGQPPAAPPAR